MIAPSPITWLGEQIEHGKVGFRIGRRGDELIAEFVGLGTLVADRRGGHARFVPAPGVSAASVEKIGQSLVPALLRHLTGKLTLHASAVVWGETAICCMGESGAGKSTTAAALCTRFGGALVADDTSAVEFRPDRVELTPTERAHWLVSGSIEPDPGAQEKRAVAPRALATAAPNLVAVCRLRFDDEAAGVELRRLRGQTALAVLLPSVIRFAIDDPAMQEREFEQLGLLTDRVPIYELRRPKNPSLIAPACEALLHLARDEGAT